MKVYKIRDEIYRAEIYVIPQATEAELVRHFARKYGMEYKHDNGVSAFHYRISSPEAGITCDYLIFNSFQNTPEGIAELAHEMMHLVFSVLYRCGMELTESSEESFSYYCGYLTKKVLDKVIK